MVLFNNRAQLRGLKGGIQASGGRIWVSTRSETTRDTDSTHANSSQEIALGKFSNSGGPTSSEFSDAVKTLPHGV